MGQTLQQRIQALIGELMMKNAILITRVEELEARLRELDESRDKAVQPE